MTAGEALAGRHAVITGGGTGIGAAVADRLDALGAHVTLMGRRREVLENKAAALAAAKVVTVDVTDEDSVAAAFAAARDGYGPVEILVNNAGATETAPLAKTELGMWRRMLDVNLTGVFLCSRAYLGQTQRGSYGRIINIASTAALKGYAYVGAYCAAKHGVMGLTRTLAVETVRAGITVNAVCPGYVDTDLLDDSVDKVAARTGRTREEVLSHFTQSNPQGRLIEPDEVAATVAWLCLPEADSITGQAIAMAGGEVMS